MNTMGISTDPSMLDVELPRTLIESPSVSTFMPDEEASVCPLLSNTNGTSTPLTFSHPLTPCVDNDSNESANLCNEDTKAETGSSTGSSSGIEVADTAATTLFSKHSAYQHFQHNNGIIQDANGNATNGSLKLSDDTPCFVSWNWPLIRKCTFFTFMSSLLAMFVVVIAMIATMPKTCNPKAAWYRGSVFYEIFPASFQDSNNDGVGDIRGIKNRIDYFVAMGIGAVRLNSIFSTSNYPEDYENVTTLIEIAEKIGNENDLQQLAESLHAHKISLILDLPIGLFVQALGSSGKDAKPTITVVLNSSNNQSLTSMLTPTIQLSDSIVSQAIRKWMNLGVDGFYIKGLERFVNDNDIAYNLAAWKNIIGSNRVLMVSEIFLNNLPSEKKEIAISHIDLVDVYLNVLSGTVKMKEYIEKKLSTMEMDTWVHWNIGGIDRDRLTGQTEHANITLAATLMELMLPGTPSIFYGDEISLQTVSDLHKEHNETLHLHHLPAMQWPHTTIQFTNREMLPWLPKASSYNLTHFDIISDMIKLRDRSPAIYKNSICKPEKTLPNTKIMINENDILVVERSYPRRNSYVSVSNFGSKKLIMDMSSILYSGIKMLDRNDNSKKIYFKKFKIGSFETIIVKMDK